MTERPSSYIAQEWSVHAQLTISHHRPDVEVTPATPQSDDGVHMEYSWNTNPRPCYGFQRGNIVFTTRPSGMSVDPGMYGSLPARRPTQVYNRRCKSTCSITLSTDHLDEGRPTVSRSHSLNTPTPCDTVREVCEVCGGDRSPSSLRRAANYTTHFCTRVPDKTQVPDVAKQSQDAASQTHDAEGVKASNITQTHDAHGDDAEGVKASSITQTNDAHGYDAEGVKASSITQTHDAHGDDAGGVKASITKPVQPRMGNKLYAKRKSVSDLLQIPSLEVPEAVEEASTDKPTKRLSRSPARLSGKSPMIASRKSSSRSPDSAAKSQGHKPRTVHIDVYCTGSDASDSSSSSSLDSDAGASWSSPQTVFESDEVRVVHTRAGKGHLPQALQTAKGYDSEDGLSSQYPSQFSSYTSFRDSNPSRDPSSSTISSSSCALSDAYDSATATSWKDTVTDDIDSILQSNLSLAQSDSFEYADSIDRLRIKQRERAWAAVEESKTWRSPQSERRHMIQQQKLKEFLEKRLWKAGKSEESEDDGDETGDAWSFGGGSSSRVSTLKREDTVRKATPANLTTQPPPDVPARRVPFPFGSRSPSPAPAKIASSVTSPFTPRAGLRTDQLSRAEKFGTIVGAFRKPGHHVGPSKNPECSCAHCRNFYFEQDECRGRTRSLDMSLEAADNWKMQLQKQIADKKLLANSEELRKYDEQWDDSTAV